MGDYRSKIYPEKLFYGYVDKEKDDSIYTFWNLNLRDKVYKLLKTNFSKIISYLNKFLSTLGDDLMITKKQVINGVTITTILEFDSIDEDKYNLQRGKEELFKAISLIKKAKLQKAITGLKVIFNFKIRKLKVDRLGEYHFDKDTLIIFNPLFESDGDMIYTIIHELGHRLENILNTRKEWEVFYNQIGKNYAPTEYSKENSQEMFAEVFALYVLGRRLPNIVESKFKEITSLK